MPDVGVILLGNGARRTSNLARKGSVSGWHIDGLAGWDGPGPMETVIVGPERGADGAGEPVERNIGQQVVAGHHRLEVAVMVRPGVKLLRDPGCKPGRGVCQ